MNPLIGINTIDIPCESPLIPGVYALGANDPLWGTIHKLAPDRIPFEGPITELRFFSQGRLSRSTSIVLSDDLSLIINDALWTSDIFQVSYPVYDGYRLRFRLSGQSVETIERKHLNSGAYSCSLLTMADGLDYNFQLSAAEPLTDISINFQSSLLERKFRRTPEAIEQLLQPIARESNSAWFNDCPMTPAMERVVLELYAMPPGGIAYRLLVEAKVLELIALYIDQIAIQAAAHASSLPAAGNVFKLSERQRLDNVVRHLYTSYQSPPSLDELCRWSGLNRKKLTQGFKQQFGKTIFEYIQHLRIEKSKELLHVPGLTVGQVAEQVGYDYQSNFTKAFKHLVGLSPKLYSQSHPVVSVLKK